MNARSKAAEMVAEASGRFRIEDPLPFLAGISEFLERGGENAESAMRVALARSMQRTSIESLLKKAHTMLAFLDGRPEPFPEPPKPAPPAPKPRFLGGMLDEDPPPAEKPRPRNGRRRRKKTT